MSTPEHKHPSSKNVLIGTYVGSLVVLAISDLFLPEAQFTANQLWLSWGVILGLTVANQLVTISVVCETTNRIRGGGCDEPVWFVYPLAWLTFWAISFWSVVGLDWSTTQFTAYLAVGAFYSVGFVASLAEGNERIIRAENYDREWAKRIEKWERDAEAKEQAEAAEALRQAEQRHKAEQARKAEAERLASEQRKAELAKAARQLELQRAAEERRNKRQARQLERQQLAEQARLNGEKPPASPSVQRQRLAAHREVLAFYHGLIPAAINPRRTAAMTRFLDQRLAQATRAPSVKAVVNDLVERLTKLDIRLRLAARYEADHDLYCDNYPADQFYSYLRRFFCRKRDMEDIRDAEVKKHKSLDDLAGKLDHLRGEKQRERKLDRELEAKLAKIEADGLRTEQSPLVIEEQKNIIRQKDRSARQSAGRGSSRRRSHPKGVIR
jgi:hypothetical protein